MTYAAFGIEELCPCVNAAHLVSYIYVSLRRAGGTISASAPKVHF